ncbi:helix-turn-helix domain-containing protein [Mesorhizobium sp. ANAO-SY3R2]|uniref:helix-turn-helix domain-containing protein n=1 Tax=Mesorhizobium sp. ANAO-SY3R2 TaxID=3166644 RepID=UPI0036701A40
MTAAQRALGRNGRSPTVVRGGPEFTFSHAQALDEQRAPIPHFEFSTDGFSRTDQFAAWRQNFAPMIDLSNPGSRTPGFDARQAIWDLGCMAFSSISTEGFDFAGLQGRVRREPLDHWIMTLLLEGHAHTMARRGSFSAGPGVVQIHALDGPFEGHVSDSHMLMLFVPRDLSHNLAATLGAAEFSTLGGGLGHLFADYMSGLARCLPTMTVADLPELATATRAMIQACVSPSGDSLEEASAPISAVLLERARQHINANLHDPGLGNESLCRALGVSRTRLYRLFEPSGGVMRYILHRRLVDAHAVLTDPADTRRIFAIAEQRGFNDGAEFSRAFRREFGYSPSEARMRGKGAVPAKPGVDLETCAPDERLGILLRRLHG